MRKATEQLRLQIIESVDTLVYQKGFNSMSFSDIAALAGVSKGNLYYYFKTKEGILQAVVAHRVNNMKQMLEDWDGVYETPLRRLKRYAEIVFNESADVVRYGCPMGSLNIELGKAQPTLKKISKKQFDVFRRWIKKQFKLLLGVSATDAKLDQLSLQLLIRTQGVAVVSQVYADKKIIKIEVQNIKQWLESLTDARNTLK